MDSNIEQEIAKQLRELYKVLVEESQPLDDESHRILYSNLWKLYGD